MAITVSTAPNGLNAAYRPIEWVVTSNAGTIVRMQAQLKIDGTNVGQPIVLDPDIGTSNQFTFNFEDIVAANLLSYENDGLPAINGGVTVDADSSEVFLNVAFTELLGESLTIGDSLITLGADTRVITATIQHEETQNLENVYAFHPTNLDTTRRFLTDYSPNSALSLSVKDMGRNENEYLSAYFDSVLDGTAYAQVLLNVITKDTDGGVVQNATIDVTALQTNKRADLPVGSTNLNSAVLVAGVQPLINSGIETYDVRVLGDGTVISETLTYNLVTRCDSTRLVWLNNSGGLDWFTFTGDLVENVDIDHLTFQKTIGSTWAITDRGTTGIGSRSRDFYSVTSQPLSFNKKRWLIQLLNSPSVWWEKDGNYIPVNITISGENEIVRKQQYKLVVVFQKSNEIIRQQN